MAQEKKHEKIRNHQHSSGLLQTWYLTKEDTTVDYKEEYVKITEERRQKLIQAEHSRAEAHEKIHSSVLSTDKARGLLPIPGDV